MKTLKDLGYCSCKEDICCVHEHEKDIRAEAVKDYKAIKNNTFHIKMNPWEAFMVEKYIKWKNNITEEDLE